MRDESRSRCHCLNFRREGVRTGGGSSRRHSLKKRNFDRKKRSRHALPKREGGPSWGEEPVWKIHTGD